MSRGAHSLDLVALLAVLLCCACATVPESGAADDVGIDHIILGAADLGEGIAEVERRTGVRAAYGGVHPGRGTRNALLSLGPSIYIEILAPDPAQHVDDLEVDALRAMPALRPIGWAVHTRDSEALRRRLQSRGLAVSSATPGSRARPDGTMVEWETFAVTKPDHELAPFFIRWADMSRHPARSSPSGCTLRSMAVSAADPTPLDSILGPLGLAVRVRRADRSRIALSLSCPRGAVSFQ